MKNSLTTRILMLLALLTTAGPAAAATDRFYAETASVLPGESATLAFRLENEQPYYGFQADIDLPAGLAVITDADGKPAVALTGRTDESYTVVTNLLDEGTVRVGAFSATHTAIDGSDGTLLTIRVKAADDFEGGTLTLGNVLFTDAADRDVAFASVTTEISNKPRVNSITLSQTTLTLPEGTSATITATVLPEDAGNKVLAWSSSDAAVATVDATGKVTAVSRGSAVITARSTDGSDITATCSVTVTRLVSGITLNETQMTLAEGATGQLIATVPDDADNKTLEWSSSNADVARVDANGKVTAVSQGKATVTVRSTDGSNVSASCEVTVVRLVSGITLSETSLTLTEGSNATLVATVAPESADNKVLSWSSGNTSVATVDNNGKVTALSQGKATITVRSTDGSDISATCEITVVKLVTCISLSQTTLTLTEGTSATITATVLPESADNKVLSWSSSNAAVATVDATGKVVAVSQGSAVITARSTDGSDITATCSVTVTRLVSGITLNETQMTLAEGATGQLIATVPDDADNKTLEWSSSNADVARVDANGKVTAVPQGKATVTVRSTDGSNVSASCEVTVVRLVSGITLSETSLTLTEGSNATLVATVAPESADNKVLSWSSGNTSVATVDNNGKVTALSQGKATITVRSTDGSDISATCEITVVKLVTGILLSEDQVNLVEGESLRITATVLPENATNTSLRWYSLDEVIATVDNGLIYAMAPGETTIVAEATDGSGVRAECHVVVEDADGIGSIAGGVSILVQQGCIVVSGLPAGEYVKVYAINGTNIFNARSRGSDIVIRPDGKGIYVVVLGTQSYKVIVR